MFTILYTISLVLALIGIFGMISQKNLIKILISLNILETGVNLFLITAGWSAEANVPIITGKLGVPAAVNFVDPLPQALVLTSIVIGLGITAVALALILRYYRKTGSLTLEPSEFQAGGER